MKWTKLNPKEPAFGERCLWMNDKGEWWEGELDEIKQTSGGKVYIVTLGSGGNMISDAVYFMEIEIPTKPKE